MPDSKIKGHCVFGIPLAQVVANDSVRLSKASTSSPPCFEAINENNATATTPVMTPTKDKHNITTKNTNVKNDDFETIDRESLNRRRSSVPSYNPLFRRSSSFNQFNEEDEIDFMNLDQETYDGNGRRGSFGAVKSDKIDNRLDRRRSRLLDALSLSSTSASYVSIIDHDEELKPPPSQVPKIVVSLIEYMEKHAIHVLGIFRTGGSKKRVRQVNKNYLHMI